MKPKYNLDYKLIGEQLDRLLQSVINKIELEWPRMTPPPSQAAFTVLAGTLRVIRNTFKTIRFLCSEKSADYRHRPELALSVPPLARTMVDALYTFVFLFEDLPARSEWYVCSGWRELAEYLDRSQRDYGSNPDWAEYLGEAWPKLGKLQATTGKSAVDLRKTPWWPTPPQMKKSAKKAETKDFFQYLDDWYYREFSSASHLSLPGLIQSAAPLIDPNDGDEKIEQMRGYYFMQATILLVALYSEVEAETKIGVSNDLRYLWTMLMEHYPFAKEIYERRKYETRVT